MRLVVGSAKVTSGGSAVRVSTDSYGRIVAFSFTARVNNLPMFIGTSSALSSANGYSVSSRGYFPPSGEMFTVPVGKGIAPSTFWVNASADTTDRIDFAFLVEP